MNDICLDIACRCNFPHYVGQVCNQDRDIVSVIVIDLPISLHLPFLERELGTTSYQELNLSQCPAVRTNYMLQHCTTLQYFFVIKLIDTVVRQKRHFRTLKSNEFNNVAI